MRVEETQSQPLTPSEPVGHLCLLLSSHTFSSTFFFFHFQIQGVEGGVAAQVMVSVSTG